MHRIQQNLLNTAYFIIAKLRLTDAMIAIF